MRYRVQDFYKQVNTDLSWYVLHEVKKRHHLATFDITSQANYGIDFCFILYSKTLDKPDLGGLFEIGAPKHRTMNSYDKTK